MIRREILLNGHAGALEVVLQIPDVHNSEYVAIVCHPHPLQEGTMDNKVVTTVAKTFNNLNYPSVRFNFRGVGNSAGSYGAIVGEVQDCATVVNWVKEQWPQAKVILAGFSFGSYVAAAVATKIPTAWLIIIAPPIERMPFDQLPQFTCPCLVIQGEDDEVVDSAGVYTWFDQLSGAKHLVRFPATGHFFHGKLIDLQNSIIENRPML